jgi:hypothetical protein
MPLQERQEVCKLVWEVLEALMPNKFCVQVESMNLLDACPIWRSEFSRCTKNSLSTPFLEYVFDLRKRWSHRVLTVAAPIDHWLWMGQRGEYEPRVNLLSTLQGLAYWQCRTDMLWRVIGPQELVGDLRWVEPHLAGWNGGSAHPLELHLCQHEIRGDEI